MPIANIVSYTQGSAKIGFILDINTPVVNLSQSFLNSVHEPKRALSEFITIILPAPPIQESRNGQYGSSGKTFGLRVLAPGLNAHRCTENPDMLCVVFADYSGKFQDITLNPITIDSIYVLRILFSLTLRLFDNTFNPYPTAFPYGNGMVLHFYQQQESSTTKTVHKVINKGLKAYV